jgi:hypothetical protein
MLGKKIQEPYFQRYCEEKSAMLVDGPMSKATSIHFMAQLKIETFYLEVWFHHFKERKGSSITSMYF